MSPKRPRKSSLVFSGSPFSSRSRFKEGAGGLEPGLSALCWATGICGSDTGEAVDGRFGTVYRGSVGCVGPYGVDAQYRGEIGVGRV